VINDFQAIGYGINLLNYNNKDDIFLVKSGKTNADSSKETKAILGAGTGLGKSILAYNEQLEAYIPIPSEGGHSDFPAQDDFEIQLLNFIKKLRNISQPITYEELLSGRGIESIYSFLKDISQIKESKYTKEIENAKDKASLISKYRTEDKICGETFRLFARYYGRCAKNFVLDTMATGGLFIAGGIATKNREIFKTKEFLDEFENAHQRKDVLNQTPIYIITNYDVSIYGACFAAMNNILDKRETI
jgi:glucokinase